MKLRQKTFLLISVTLLCLSAALYHIAQKTLRQQAWQAEELMARENVTRVKQALDQQLEPLALSNADWARWNDAYQFIEDRNRNFYNDNLTDSTIVTLQAQVIIFGRVTGELLFACGYDLGKQRKLPVPKGLAEYIASNRLIPGTAADGKSLKGFLRLPEGVLLISSQPVTRGNGTGRIKGFMLIGRWWNAGLQKELERVTRLKVTAQPWDKTNASASLRDVKRSLEAGPPTQIEPLSSSTLIGFTVVKDLIGKPISLLSVETPRAISQQSRRSLRNLLLSMMILGIVFSLLMLAVMDYLVLHRLRRLTNELDIIGDSTDRKVRVTMSEKRSGRDELYHLAEQINITLENLSRARATLEERVAQRTVELEDTNTALHAEIVERQMMMGTLRELVQQLENARDQAQHASQAKNDFLSRMSHELRTPLNAIIGFGQLLELDELTSEQQESVAHILKAGHHLLALISEILDITRIEAGTINLSPEPIRVSDIIEETCAMLQPLADKQKISIVVGRESQNKPRGSLDKTEEAWVCVDCQRLKQILLNLLSNAVKYNNPHGTVYVDYHVSQANVRICVQDDGPGLNDEQKKKIFSPFDRLGAESTAIEGTGIGLTLSKHLAEAMDGSLNFDHDRTEGSLFWVEIPLASCPANVVEIQTDAASHADKSISTDQLKQQDRKEKRLVYVEDNPSNRRLIEIMVKKRAGFELELACDGEAGLRLLRATLPDLLLLDAHLPDMDGEEILSLLRQDATWKNIPIVIVTADATPERQQRMMQAGANAVLTKPIHVENFWETIESLLDEKSMIRN
ncbi:MAG TPA: CHASE4 domain-containing protein [Abditibacteriaceae bacterium]